MLTSDKEYQSYIAMLKLLQQIRWLGLHCEEAVDIRQMHLDDLIERIKRIEETAHGFLAILREYEAINSSDTKPEIDQPKKSWFGWR